MHAGMYLHEITISVCPDLAWMEVHCNTEDYVKHCTTLLTNSLMTLDCIAMDMHMMKNVSKI